MRDQRRRGAQITDHRKGRNDLALTACECQLYSLTAHSLADDTVECQHGDTSSQEIQNNLAQASQRRVPGLSCPEALSEGHHGDLRRIQGGRKHEIVAEVTGDDDNRDTGIVGEFTYAPDDLPVERLRIAAPLAGVDDVRSGDGVGEADLLGDE